jgi:hypothetical protein
MDTQGQAQPDGAARLLAAARDRAAARGFIIGNGADGYLAADADRAAAQLPAEDAEAWARAEAAFAGWIDTMIDVRPEAYAGQPERLADVIIGEDTYMVARLRLCPGFFPIC